MARFQDKNLMLRDDQWIFFGTGDGDPCDPASYDSAIGFDGTELMVTTVISGVTPTENYHLTTKQYVDELNNAEDWQDSVLDYTGTPPGGPTTGDRYLVASGTGAWTGLDDSIVEWDGDSWEETVPNEGFATWVEDEDQAYVFRNGEWVPFVSTMYHSAMLGLTADDHLQYVRADGGVGDSRGFTATVSGIDPVEDYHLTTKYYVDGEVSDVYNDVINYITTTTGILDHGLLTGLGDDDHTYYVPTDGSRGFTSTVSGIYPVEDYHLATKQYIDDIVLPSSTLKTGREALATNDSTKAVLFDEAFIDDSYSISAALTYSGTGTPAIYPYVIASKTDSGFTVHFSGDMCDDSYSLEWIAHYDV